MAAEKAALALSNLTFEDDYCKPIVDAGAIPLLVPLLRASAKSEAPEDAAWALANLAATVEYSMPIVDAGAIPLLVPLLLAGARTAKVEKAALALGNLAEFGPPAVQDAVLAAAAAEPVAFAASRILQRQLRPIAKQRLHAAMAAERLAALHAALAAATSLAVSAEELEAARALLPQLEQAEARQARRESLGLGGFKLPAEFVCPISCDKMKDPVVASDGHSYEREEINRVLRKPRAERLSPLTREELEPSLFPNRNLRKRIEEYEEEMLTAAQQAVQHHVEEERRSEETRAGVKRDASAAGSSEVEPAAKRVRG